MGGEGVSTRLLLTHNVSAVRRELSSEEMEDWQVCARKEARHLQLLPLLIVK